FFGILKSVFNSEPVCGKWHSDFRHLGNCLLSSLMQIRNSDIVLAVGFDKGPNLWMASLETSIVQLKGMLGKLVLHYNNRRVSPKALNMLQPVFGIVIFTTFAPVKHQQIKTAFREKELMSGVHNFLPA